MSEISDSLDRADEQNFTRPIPKSAGAQVRYLVKQLKSTKAVADLLAISRRTVERYVKDQIKQPKPALSTRLEREVRRRWQPLVRKRARAKAAKQTGLVIETRARFGFSAAPGTTDDGRMRRITQHLPGVRLPPLHRPGGRRQRGPAPQHRRRRTPGDLLQGPRRPGPGPPGRVHRHRLRRAQLLTARSKVAGPDPARKPPRKPARWRRPADEALQSVEPPWWPVRPPRPHPSPRARRSHWSTVVRASSPMLTAAPGSCGSPSGTPTSRSSQRSWPRPPRQTSTSTSCRTERADPATRVR